MNPDLAPVAPQEGGTDPVDKDRSRTMWVAASSLAIFVYLVCPFAPLVLVTRLFEEPKDTSGFAHECLKTYWAPIGLLYEYIPVYQKLLGAEAEFFGNVWASPEDTR